jgi:hypothetical protein
MRYMDDAGLDAFTTLAREDRAASTYSDLTRTLSHM